jgi:hypothetical protein
MLHNLYASPNTGIIRVKEDDIAGWNAARVTEMEDAYNIFVGETEGQRPMHGWMDGWMDGYCQN